MNITLKQAKALSEEHKALDSIEDDSSLYNENFLSPAECCGALIMKFLYCASSGAPYTARDFAGARLYTCIAGHGERFAVAKGETYFNFEVLSQGLTRLMGTNFKNSHQTCINACKILKEGIIHTAETSIVEQEKIGLPGRLSSFIEIEDEIFDFTNALKMSKKEYYEVFHVKEISNVKVSTVRSDILDDTYNKIQALPENVTPEQYLMARADCVKMIGKGK